jgi:gas vesicle protein
MEKQTNNFGIGLIFGILLGALAGILLAPSTGEETRRKLMETTEDAQSNLKNLSQKVKKETEEMIRKGKDFVKEIEKNASNKAQSLEQDLKEKISDYDQMDEDTNN